MTRPIFRPALNTQVRCKAFYDAYGEDGWVVTIDLEKRTVRLATNDEWRRSDYKPANARPAVPWAALSRGTE